MIRSVVHAGLLRLPPETSHAIALGSLDLLAQLECQLRAVHRTMRQIEKLRSAKSRREGATPSNGEKLDALEHLTREVEAIDRELATQHESCGLMLETVETMRGREGGYWLARPPAEISYGEIVRLTRGSLGLLPCASRFAHEQCKNCISEDKCRLHRAMLTVRDETARILDGLTLADPVPLPPEPAETA